MTSNVSKISKSMRKHVLNFRTKADNLGNSQLVANVLDFREQNIFLLI